MPLNYFIHGFTGIVMEYQEKYLKKIKINAGNEDIYALDITDGKEDGFEIQDCFYDISLIDELHKEFLEWLTRYWNDNLGDFKFPWNVCNTKRIELP